MSNFTRYIKDISGLKTCLEQDVFMQKVNKELVQTGKAFLAFRDENATVYYEGRQLCKIHCKADNGKSGVCLPTIYNHYLPVIRSRTLTGSAKKESYSEEVYLRETDNFCNFAAALPEILDNMNKERDDEAYQVSGFYKFSPMLPDNCSAVILLDIEAAFSQTGEKTDRIDMVLYNTVEKQLIFVEVKRLGDKRLYKDPKTKAPAEILDQLARYRNRLATEKDIVIKAYNRVIEYYNSLSTSSQKIPLMDVDKSAEPLLGLLIVECTNIECYHRENASDQFKELCRDLEQNNFKMHTYGSLKNATPGTLLDIYKRFN